MLSQQGGFGMASVNVLVVDDDPKILELMTVNLSSRGYQVRAAKDGHEAIILIEEDVPDLVILDLVMPGLTGNDVCIWIRERYDLPIIVLSAYDEEELKVNALDAGADDYVLKPFKLEEFLARVRAVMRRANDNEPILLENSPHQVRIGTLTINLKGKRAFVGNKDIHLTRTEFALLSTLAQNMDSVLSHDELLAKVWGDDYRGSNHYLHVYLGRIRKKMGDENSAYLETVSGFGYILHSSLPG